MISHANILKILMADAEVKFTTEVEDKASAKLDNLGKTLKTLAGVALAAFSIKAIADFGKACIDAASEGEQVGIQLANAVSNAKAFDKATGETKEGVAKVRDELEAYGSELQKISTYDDEAINTAQTKLIQAGLTQQSEKKLVKALMDRVAATESVENQDAALVNLSEVMGKAVQGNTGILARYNIHLTDSEEKQLKLMDAQERSSFIADKLTESYGGAAEEMRDSTAGAMKAMTEDWSNLQQSIGEVLAPIVAKVLAFGLELIGNIRSFMDTIGQLWESDWGGIRSTVEAVWNFLLPFFTLNVNELIAQAVVFGQQLVDGFQAFMTTLKEFWASDWGHVRSTIEGVINWFLNDFLPTFQGWVEQIQEIIAPMVQFFIDHWDEIKGVWDVALQGLKALWDVFWLAIKTAFTIAWDIIKGLINTALALLKGDWQGAWDAIKAMFTGVWEAMKTFVIEVGGAIWKWINETFLQPIVEKFEWVKTEATKTWDSFWNGLKGVVSTVVGWIMDQVQKIMDTIDRAFKYLDQLAKKAQSGISSGVGSFASVGNSIGNALNLNNYLPGRATGGSVVGGQGYVVGENGPERFVPGRSGTIIPHGGGGTTIVLNFNGPVSSKEIALEYADIALRHLQLSTQVI